MRVVVVGLALLVVAACSSTDKYAPLEAPDPVDAEPTSSTVPLDLDSVQLAPVDGTTTTVVAVGPGPVKRIVGRVDGPDGPVGGARVRLERLVGDSVVTVDVPTAADGTWNIENVLGGRYRIRAWLTPELAMVRPQLVFIEAPESKPVFLQVERFRGMAADAALAPSPPQVDEEANLKIRVSVKQVDANGVVRATPQPGVEVELSGVGEWSVRSSRSETTDGSGSVVFEVVCREAGAQPLSAVLDETEIVPLDLPACVDESATTTSSSTTSTTEP